MHALRLAYRGAGPAAPDAPLHGGGGGPTLSDMERVAVMEAVVKRIEKDLDELKSDGKNTRATVVIVGLALAALVVAIWQAQISQMANMLAAFQSGLSSVQATQSAPPASAPQPIIIQIPAAPAKDGG